MKIEFGYLYNINVKVNNYQKGTFLKTTPLSKIVKEEVIGKNNTIIYYEDLTCTEVERVQKAIRNNINVTLKYRP